MSARNWGKGDPLITTDKDKTVQILWEKNMEGPPKITTRTVIDFNLIASLCTYTKGVKSSPHNDTCIPMPTIHDRQDMKIAEVFIHR